MSLVDDDYYMALAIKEAKKGIGRTSPNPIVGAVIVNDGRIVGRGFHKKAGTPHAEIHALHDAGEKSEGATMYVTLEPCSHTGRTPPCCEAIVKGGIKNICIGMEDPNPLVSGAGNRFLKEHGVKVTTGINKEQCIFINRPFIKHITRSIPWVVMKAGISLDGKLSYAQGVGGRITGDESSRKVHRLRNTNDAILVGAGTVIIDNPSLTTRIAGRKGHDPVRVVLDTRLDIPLSTRLFHLESKAPTWVFCGPNSNTNKILSLRDLGVLVDQVKIDSDGHVNLHEVLKKLGKKGITSIIVEGGAKVHTRFLQKRLIDTANLFLAPIFVGDQGVSIVESLTTRDSKEAIRLVDLKYKRFGQDIMIEGNVEYSFQ